jgi:cellulose biosynthesis protein BcsQ
MDEYDLGPNGGLIFCMESLLENIDWLEEQIENLIDDSDESLYVIIDCPGQVRSAIISYRKTLIS